MKVKNLLLLVLVALFLTTTIIAKAIKRKAAQEIVAITREAGSGTRGAFIELFGIEEKNAEGKKVDLTSPLCDVTQSTQVCMQSVKNNAGSIGYVSLGALNDTVKAVKIEGTLPTVTNIKNNTYKISRPFNIILKVTEEGADTISDAGQEVINYILSIQGQEVIQKNSYIPVSSNVTYNKKNIKGKVSISGSSSVYPIMEKLCEAFGKVNSDIEVELSQSDSTIGITSAKEGVIDIGMASRALKESEEGVRAITIAQDGIALIVNKENKVSNLTIAQVKDIYTAKITKWQELQ